MGAVELRIPSLIPGVEVYSLPLDSMDGFVFSVVDGTACVEEIAFICGIEVDRTLRILERLVELGAVRWAGSKVRTSRRPAELGRTTEGSNVRERESHPSSLPGIDRASVRSPPLEHTADSERPATAQPLAYDPAELEEDVGLSRERRLQILEAYHRLESQDLYQVLGVARDAEKKEIRAAYYGLSKLFHPDSVFGKRLGSYKSKMETVFKKLTEAHDVLGNKKRRKEYDEYLAAAASTYQAHRALARGRKEAERLEREVSSAGYSEQGNPTASWSSPEPREDRDSAVQAAVRTSGRISLPTMDRPSLTPEERRLQMGRMLRTKLDRGRSLNPPSRSSKGPVSDSVPASADPSVSDGERRSDVVLGLARSLKSTSEVTGGDSRVRQFVRKAKESERDGDLVAAANALRLALAMAPERRDVELEYQRLSALVAATLADQYEKRATYEERAGKWGDAAVSWAKVSEGRPHDAIASRKVAEALLRAGGDLHRAKQFAFAAVQLAPDDVASRSVLARVYLAAGLKRNATRELENALKLDPKNQMVKNLLKEAR